MSLTMYRASIPVFIHGLNVLSTLLDKGQAHADQRGLAHSQVIEARLAADMLPLSGQIQRASDTAKLSAQRLAGVEAPRFEDNEDTFAALEERVTKTRAWLESIDASKLDGSETRDIPMKFPKFEASFSGEDYLLSFGLPNFYFHIVTTYDILRHLGVPLGKPDYLGKLI
jgi:uncharacterized protein